MHKEQRTEPIDKIVVHVNVGPEVQNAAEGLRGYLAGIDAGYHRISDDKVIVITAGDDQVVWGAPYVNARALHICLIGQADQTAAQWDDAYSRGELLVSAAQVATWCHDYHIPIRRLTVLETGTIGTKGICGHIDVTNAYKAQGLREGHILDHWDPGPNFPWGKWLELITVCFDKLYLHTNPAPIGAKDMSVFIDRVNSTDPNRPRTVEVDQSGNMILTQGAKLNAGQPVKVPNSNLTIMPSGYTESERHLGAQLEGPNGFVCISDLGGARAAHHYQFVK